MTLLREYTLWIRVPRWSPWFCVKDQNHTEPDQMNTKVVSLWRCFLRAETMGCSVHSVVLLIKHAEIFGDNLLNTIPFHVQLTCDHSNSQLMITTHHLLFQHNVDYSCACWSPCIFLWITRALKNTWTREGVICLYLKKHFKCLWWNFPQLDHIYQVYSLLRAHTTHLFPSLFRQTLYLHIIFFSFVSTLNFDCLVIYYLWKWALKMVHSFQYTHTHTHIHTRMRVRTS